MAPRHLHLHETIDVVGQGQYDYMDHVGREPTNAMADMLTLQGTFFVCAVGGGRWPQVINLWDVGEGGWEAWAAPFRIFGSNAILAFVGSGLMARLLSLIRWSGPEGETVTLQQWLYATLYRPNLPDYWASFAWAMSYIAIWLAILTLLDRKRIYLKV